MLDYSIISKVYEKDKNAESKMAKRMVKAKTKEAIANLGEKYNKQKEKVSESK